MIVHKLPYIIYRSYPEYGYLIDNRNFGYDTATNSCLKVGDLLLSKEGSLFYSQLLDKPQDINLIVGRLCKLFTNVTQSVLYKDALEFYSDLHKRGFMFCGEKKDLAHNLQKYFSYDCFEPYVLDFFQEKNSQISYNKAFGGEYRLSRVHVNISSRCNENCIHCYIPSKDKRSIMSEEMFEKVLCQCISMQVLNITISGGEPMLNPLLKSFLLKCKVHNFSINLLSNITLLTEDLLNTIADNPLISVQTSLYAMDEKIHDSITRNKGTFQKTLHSIKLLRDRNVPLQINCPIMVQNRLYYKAVLEFAGSQNIKSSSDYSLFGCYDSKRSNLYCRLSLEDIGEIIKSDFHHESYQKQIIETANLKKTEPDDRICSVCKSSLCISDTGDVYPCEGWQGLLLGSLEKQSLKEIWEEAPMVQKLRSLTYKDFPKCNACRNKKYCKTCLIMNANESPNGNYMEINPFMCEVAEMKRKEMA